MAQVTGAAGPLFGLVVGQWIMPTWENTPLRYGIKKSLIISHIYFLQKFLVCIALKHI
jgi:hypothetical protein